VIIGNRYDPLRTNGEFMTALHTLQREHRPEREAIVYAALNSEVARTLEHNVDRAPVDIPGLYKEWRVVSEGLAFKGVQVFVIVEGAS
jgi:hypothetical protein